MSGSLFSSEVMEAAANQESSAARENLEIGEKVNFVGGRVPPHLPPSTAATPLLVTVLSVGRRFV